MTVYVDDMRAQYCRMVMCHMVADTDAELHAMAARIGVDRRWWQSPKKTSGSHYDICLSKRALAVAAGAVEITWRQCGAMNTRRRISGELGPPAEAVAWLTDYRHRLATAGSTSADNSTADPAREVRWGCTYTRRMNRMNASALPKQTHELKTDPEAFEAQREGRKTSEIRKNDRGFRVGDELILRETVFSAEQMRVVGRPLLYTGRELRRIVTHIQSGFGLKDGYVALSVVPVGSRTSDLRERIVDLACAFTDANDRGDAAGAALEALSEDQDDFETAGLMQASEAADDDYNRLKAELFVACRSEMSLAKQPARPLPRGAA